MALLFKSTLVPAAIFVIVSLTGCGDPKEEEGKAAGKGGKAPRQAVTVATTSSPSILDQAKATKRFPLPERLFEEAVAEDETAQEVLVTAGLAFPDGTRAEFDRETNELEVTHFPTDLMLAEAVVDSWRWVGWAKKVDGILTVEEKLKQIVLPKVEFADTSLEDAIQFLASESELHDPGIGGGSGVKISFGVGLLPSEQSRSGSDGFGFGGAGEGEQSWVGDVPITLRLSNVPLGEALRYTTALAQLKYYVASDGAFVTYLHGSRHNELQTQVFSVPPNFLDLAQEYEDSLGVEDFGPSPFDNEEVSSNSKPKKVRELMESAGITFPPSSQEIWDSARSLLIMKNTQDQLELVEAYLGFIAQLDAESDWARNREAQIRRKLSSIRMPKFTSQEAEIWSVISVLIDQARAYDRSVEIWDRGLPIRFEAAPLSEEDGSPPDPFADPLPIRPRISVELTEPLLGDLIQEIARQIDCTVEVDAGGVVLRENP